MIKLIKIFFLGEKKLVAWFGAGVILALTGSGVWLSFEFLDWYKKFFDALNAKDFATYNKELKVFCILASASIVQYAVTRFANQHYCMAWRQALTEDILKRWHGQEVEGYAQRIQEDCAKFARLFETIFVGGFNAVVSIIVFTPVLWKLSVEATGNGGLWFLCFGYTLFGICLSFFLGRKLPRLEYNNQVAEARFRRALEFKSGNYKKMLDNIKLNYTMLFSKYKIFNLFSSSFFQFGIIVPYLIAGKYYFIGLISMGALIQVGKSFNKVNESMGYLVDNWLSITELQSVILRLKEFEEKLQ